MAESVTRCGISCRPVLRNGFHDPQSSKTQAGSLIKNYRWRLFTNWNKILSPWINFTPGYHTAVWFLNRNLIAFLCLFSLCNAVELAMTLSQVQCAWCYRSNALWVNHQGSTPDTNTDMNRQDKSGFVSVKVSRWSRRSISQNEEDYQTVFAYSLSHNSNLLVIVHLSSKHTYTSLVAGRETYNIYSAGCNITGERDEVDYFSDVSDGLIIVYEMALLQCSIWGSNWFEIR